MKFVAVTLCLALAILIAGCGDSEETSSPPEEPTTSQTKTAAERSEAPSKDLSEIPKTPAEEAQLKREYANAGRWKVLKKKAGSNAGRLIIPIGPPPREIVIKDLRKGSGPALHPKDQFKIAMLGFDYSSGELVENFRADENLWWVYGTGEVNDAWEASLKGMRVGDLREVIAPAALLHDNDAAIYLFRLVDVFKE